MPLAVSVTDGVAFGFITFALLKLATGRHRELDGLGYVFALLFLLRYAMAR
jgi:AGZA family xanthine/uracil permease-like MFS transporter